MLVLGNTEEANCRPCTPGYFCDGVGLVRETGLCAPGFYCPEGQSTDSPQDYICPRGFECPVGSAEPLVCARGYYQEDMNQPDCDLCPSGKYCDPFELNNVTGVITPEDCPMGYYCPFGTEVALQNPCEAGTFGNTTQLTSQGLLKYFNLKKIPRFYIKTKNFVLR